MKKVIFLLVILLISLFGCKSNVVDPLLSQQNNFIPLPKDPALGDTTKFDTYYQITGAYSYNIKFTRLFTGGPFGQYSVSAILDIQAGTIPDTDTLLCLLSVYTDSTCILVSPLLQYFAHPFKLTLKYTGIDLQNLDVNNLQFVYSNGTDVTYTVSYDAMSIDYATGTLEVINAVIQYDPRIVPEGRYGWVRKAD